MSIKDLIVYLENRVKSFENSISLFGKSDSIVIQLELDKKVLVELYQLTKHNCIGSGDLNMCELYNKIKDKIIVNEHIDKNTNSISWVKNNKTHIISLIDQFIKEELPSSDTPFHYEKEIASGMKRFKNWLDNQ